MKHQDRQTAAAYTKWISSLMDMQAAYVTLTLKQGLKLEDGTWVRLTREIAINELKRTFKLLDRLILKSAAIRHNKRLARAVFFEGGGDTGKNLHVHMIVEIPSPDRLKGQSFFQLFENLWSDSTWSREESDFKVCHYVPGAVGYSFKSGYEALILELCEFPNVGCEPQ